MKVISVMRALHDVHDVHDVHDSIMLLSKSQIVSFIRIGYH